MVDNLKKMKKNGRQPPKKWKTTLKQTGRQPQKNQINQNQPN
jgi:hypothetical protein